MHLSDLLQHYGYLAVFVGGFVEGETILMLGGYAAHRGYLELPWVIVTAFAAAVASDQAYFHLSRHYGGRLLSRFPALRPTVERALRLVERHGSVAVVSMRFLWGLRIALPFGIGLSGMSARRYLLLDVAGAAVWSCTFGLAGYGATQLLAQWLGHVHRYEKWIVGSLVLLAIGVLVWRWRPLRSRRAATCGFHS